MKKYLLYLALQLLFFCVNAQKHDNVWIMGENELSKTSIMHFPNSKLTIDSMKYVFSLNSANGSICDEDGRLLFFTNGLQVANQKFEIMEGGDRIVPSTLAIDQYRKTGFPIMQFCMVLPYISDSNKYYLFYYDFDLVQFPDKKYYFTSLNSLYTTIDFSENPLGKATNVDSVIFTDTLTFGQLAACRHGNGRDWWVILPGNKNDFNHKLLINNEGVNYYDKQKIGTVSNSLFGQSFFTPNGGKFLRISNKRRKEPSWVDIYDFNRCSGELSNFKHIILEDSSTVVTCGGAVSSNSRYLYVSYNNFIFQYDLEASDIASTRDTVAVYDKFIDPATGFPTGFFLAQLAPDGKIYINTSNSTAWMHVIDKPDEKGKACNVIQHGVKLPTYNDFTMPNFPNYRLGRLIGSPCDTIRVTTHEITKEDYHLKVFPNPATTELKIDITLPQYDAQTATEIRLVSATGAIVKTYTMPDFAYLATLDISDVESGFYEVQLRQRGKTMAVEKVVVVR